MLVVCCCNHNMLSWSNPYTLAEQSETYANLGKSDPQIGEKRKAEDEEQ